MLFGENFYRHHLRLRAIVPVFVAEQLSEELHRSISGGHKGIAATKHKIRERYWWPGLTRTIEEVIRRCFMCQKLKPVRQLTKGPLFPINCGYPMQTADSGGEKYIIFLVDAFSKWIEEKAVTLRKIDFEKHSDNSDHSENESDATDPMYC